MRRLYVVFPVRRLDKIATCFDADNQLEMSAELVIGNAKHAE